MGRDDPGLDPGRIASCLETQYGLRVSSIAFLPIGYDPNTAVYSVLTHDGTAYFLKLWFSSVNGTGLFIPRLLTEIGISNILAPIPTRSNALWCSLAEGDDLSAALFPFIQGESALVAGLSDDQWRQFGTTLRAVHASRVHERLRGQIPEETFALPSATLVPRMSDLDATGEFASAAARRFAAFWRANDERIGQVVDRAEELGQRLQSKSFRYTLCHADIHAGNILAADDGQISLIDWDGPRIAPIERDLLFVVGGAIARTVEPREERLFFEGYGAVEIDPTALAYYRYERVIEDIGAFARDILCTSERSEQSRQDDAELVMSFFGPGGDIDRAERDIPMRLPR